MARTRDGNDNADWGRTVEIVACERWQLEHVAGEVAAPGWYMLSRLACSQSSQIAL